MAIDQVRVGGNLYSWNSTIFKIDGDPVTGATEISWDEKRTRTKSRGQGKSGAPRGRTAGVYEPGTLKVKLHKDSARDLRAYLATRAEDGVSFGNAVVPISLQYVEADETPVVHEFAQCVVTSDGGAEKEGSDPSMEDWEFDFMFHKTNGLSLFDNSEGLR